MIKRNKVAASISVALAFGYSASAFAIPDGSAVASALLTVYDFTILAGNQKAGKNPAADPTLPIGTTVLLNSVSTNSDITAVLNGVQNAYRYYEKNFVVTALSDPAPTVASSVDLGVPFTLVGSTGAGFVPGTALTTDPLTNYAGGYTSSVGNALNPTTADFVPVHSEVSLRGATGTGTSTSNQKLLTEFTLTVGTSQWFELEFAAQGFLRAALGQTSPINNSADASYSWTTTVVRKNADGSTANVLLWNPDGEQGTGFGGASNSPCRTTDSDAGTLGVQPACVEYADAFAMANNAGLQSKGDSVKTDGDAVGGSRFEMELWLTAGTYSFTISHTTLADAKIVVPEPATVALLGLGLLGLAGISRRPKSRSV